MTLKLAQFSDDPKNIHKIFIPQKNINFSENPKKYWNSEFLTKKNRPSLRMCENIRVPPPPPGDQTVHARIQEFSPGGGVHVNLTKKLWQRFYF